MEQVKVEVIQKRNENPFFGMGHTLSLYQSMSKPITESMLSAAFRECNTKEKKEMFYSLLFAVGDITAREHNIFRKTKVDNGGNAHRENFYTIINWMKKEDYKQFVKFLWAKLFNEYTSFDAIITARVKTDARKFKVVTAKDTLGSNQQIGDLADYLSEVIKKGNDFDKWLLAKFLTRPRLSKRQKHKKILPQTLSIHKKRAFLLQEISKRCGFEVIDKGKFQIFKGLYEWKAKHNELSEAKLFSSKRILELDNQQFIQWLSSLPASARFRVRKRLLTKEGAVKPKWGDLGNWYLQWENYKLEKQAEQRVLEVKVEQGTASTEDKEKLVKVKKEAKVSVGAINYVEMFVQIMTGKIDSTKIQPFLDKVELPYNTLVFVDDSGSMQSSYHLGNFGYTPFDLATFIAAISLLKNKAGSDLIGLFSNKARMFSYITAIKKTINSIVNVPSEQVNLPLYNKEMKFEDNLYNLRAFCKAMQTGNGTDISSIPENLHQWTNGDSEKIEQLQQYPVWTLISDGNFNNLGNATASMNDFMTKCERYFGFRPFIFLIDVAGSTSADIKLFTGISNMMLIPPNPNLLVQFLMNFKDFDIMDIYTPLLSLHRSSRYAPVRNAVI